MKNLLSHQLLSLTTALVLSFTPLLASPPPAGATTALENSSPTAGRIVNRQGHVDSPKIFWDANTRNFTLKAKADQLLPLEQTVNYLDKIVSRRNQEFYYQVPNDPRQAFLGRPGTQVFWAPNNVVPRSQQLWIGFGADANIPVENFRDQSFTLDLVDFSGPGRMDLFVLTLDPDFMLENPVTRLLSSHEPGLRSTWIKPGLHTHNHTTFTQPGRYRVTYRASARTTDGQLIASAPQTVYWQVGGNNPGSSLMSEQPSTASEVNAVNGATVTVDPLDFARAYNQAPATTDTASFQPVFTVKPAAPNPTYAAAKLSELSFTTGNPADEGTAVFFINGYFLASALVRAGEANLVELLGADQAQLQVVYIPNVSAVASASPRWVSAQLAYAQGAPEVSTGTTGVYPVPAADSTLPAFSFHDRVVTDPTVNVSVSQSETHFTVTVNPAQSDLPLHVSGGLFSGDDEDYPACEVNFISFPGLRSMDFSKEDCTDISALKVTLTPDARTPFAAARLSLPVADETTAQATRLVAGAFSADPASSTVDTGITEGGTISAPQNGSDAEHSLPGDPLAPTPAEPEPADPALTDSAPAAPSPNQPAPNQPTPAHPAVGSPDSSEKPSALLNSQVVITDGHLDIGPRLLGDKLMVAVKDDSRQHSSETVLRTPESVIVSVPRQAAVKRSKRIFGDASFDFLGKFGAELYVLGATQQAGRPWPGFSTEDFDYARFSQGVTLELTGVAAPAGANWWGFTSAPLGGLGEMIFDGAKPAKLSAAERMHMHLNWMFTHPGTYRLQLRASVDRVKSEPVTLTFVVAKNVSEGASTPLPSPTENPSVTLPGNNPPPSLSSFPHPSVTLPTDVTTPSPTPSESQSVTLPTGDATLGDNSTLNHPKQLPNTGATAWLLLSLALFTGGAGVLILALSRRRVA